MDLWKKPFRPPEDASSSRAVMAFVASIQPEAEDDSDGVYQNQKTSLPINGSCHLLLRVRATIQLGAITFSVSLCLSLSLSLSLPILMSFWSERATLSRRGTDRPCDRNRYYTGDARGCLPRGGHLFWLGSIWEREH